ncbi:MAG: metallophosphoesterase [Clostridia bacterium]|nr:metallophosphoesterase [Clostridia bacterium]
MRKEKDNTRPKKKRGRIFLRVLGAILCVILAFVLVTTIVTIIGSQANYHKAKQFAPLQYDAQLVPEEDEAGNWSFVTDEPFKVLQLTDVHIGGGWMSLKKDSMALNAVAAMVTAEKPDLVIVTGDVAYPVPFQAGTFNNKTGARIFAALMEDLGVYWTLAFGNHDTEAYSYFSREKISRFYEEGDFPHCLFKAGPADVDGFGNQIINVKNSDGIITQSLFLFDSHSYTDNDWFGVLWKYDNIHENQVAWYRDSLAALNAQNDARLQALGMSGKSSIPSLAFFHIPLVEMKNAWDAFAENGYQDTDNVKLIYGVAGETGKVVYCGMHEDDLFETMQELGSTKGVFFGHDHLNNFSVDCDGIRLTYGMSVDYLAYPGIYKKGAQRGCTVIDLLPDGSFDYHPENYYQAKYISQYEKESVTMQEVTYAEAQ